MNDIEIENQKLVQENLILKQQISSNQSHVAQNQDAVSTFDNALDISELLKAIWQGKWIIVGFVLLSSIASVLYALSLANEYRSTVILAPASQAGGNSGFAKLAGQFSGFASLAGLSLGGMDGEDKVVIAMEVIKTWDFLEKFIEENNIQVELFAARGWSKKNNELIIDPEVYDVKNKKWVREFDPSKGETAEPSSWELYLELKDRVSIKQDKRTGLLNISVEYYSPFIARDWVTKLTHAINLHMQVRYQKEARKSIEYLSKKINETNIAEMKSVFYQLVEEQTKTLMLAEVSDEYVFKTLSPARAPVKKSKPSRAMVVIFSVFLGGLLSILVVLIKHYFRKVK